MCLADPKTAKFPEVIFAIVLFIVSFVESIFALEVFERSQREIITKWFSFQQEFNLEINQMQFQELHQFLRFPIHRPALHHFLYAFIARYTLVARSSLWLRFTSCFNWSMISPDDWTRRSSEPNGSRFSKPIKPFDIASIIRDAFHPFAITFLLSLDVIWLYVSMNQLARNALKHVYTIMWRNDDFMSRFIVIIVQQLFCSKNTQNKSEKKWILRNKFWRLNQFW